MDAPEVRSRVHDTREARFVQIFPFAEPDDSGQIWVTKAPEKPVTVGLPFFAVELTLDRAQAFSTGLTAAVKIASSLEVNEHLSET